MVTVDKASTFYRSAYPSNCGKEQRSVLLFSIVAAVSTGAPQAEMFRSGFFTLGRYLCLFERSQMPAFSLWEAGFPAFEFRTSPKARFVSDTTRHR